MSTMKKLQFLSIILFLLFFFVCNSDNPTNPSGNNLIMPLSVGNHWTYIDSTFYDNIPKSDTSKTGIIGEMTIQHNNETHNVYFFNNYNKETGEPDISNWLIKNEKNGIWEYGIMTSKDTLIVPNLAIKYPVSIGDTWKRYVYSIGYYIEEDNQVIDTLDVKCISANEELKTFSGIYNCYVYHYCTPTASSADIYLYFSENIGQVGMIIKGKENGKITFKRLLLSYQLK